MNSTMGDFIHWMLRASWQAAILVLLILALQWAFGKRLGARWRHALWFLVLVRLALPFPPVSAFSLFNFAPADKAIPAPVPAIVPAASAPTQIMHVRESLVSVNAPPGPPDVDQPSSIPVEPAKTSESGLRNLNISLLCAWLWAAGVVVLLARIIGQNVVFLRGLRSARLIGDGETLALFGRCRAELGVRARLRLTETAQVKSPALYGLVRPWLLLPAGMTQRFGPEELRYIFLHELAHVKRRDMAVHWAATALQVLHWFNPVLWFGFRRMAADREVACDELALSHAGDHESRHYGETVIKLLELCASPSAAPGLLGILEDKNQMTRRIAMIAGFKRHSRWSLPAMALLLALGVAGLTDAKPRVIAAKPAAAAPNAPAAAAAVPGNQAAGIWSDNLGDAISVESDQFYHVGRQFRFYGAKVKTVDEQGRTAIIIEAPELICDRDTGEISSSNLVKLRTGDDLLAISGEGVRWQKTNNSFGFSNRVHAVLHLPWNASLTWFQDYPASITDEETSDEETRVSGTINLYMNKNDNSPPDSRGFGPGVEFTADRCEYTPGNQSTARLSVFSGHVLMNTGGHRLFADEIRLNIPAAFISPEPAPGQSAAATSPNGVGIAQTNPTPLTLPAPTKPSPVAKDGFIQGTVLQPDGKPAANAQVALKKTGRPLTLRNGRLAGYPNDPIVETDADGYFSLPVDSNAAALFIVHGAGFVKIPAPELAKAVRSHQEPLIHLEAYGNIQGTMRTGNQPVTNQMVRLFDFNSPAHEELTYDFNDFRATTDDQGRFVFNHVPPGERSIGRVTREANGSFMTEYVAQVAVKPGEVAKVAIGGNGRAVTGELALNRPEVKADWSRAQIRLYTQPPVEFRRSSTMWGWLNADRVNRHSFLVKGSPDGSFRFDDVPAGNYEVSASVTEPTDWTPQSSSPPPFDTIASAVQEVVVPEMAGGRRDEPLDLGLVTLFAYHKPAVGEAATLFETKMVEGQPLKLADYRGKYVLLDLGYYQPTNEPPELKSLSQTWGKDDRLVIITLFPDALPASQYAVSGTGAHWIQGVLGDSFRTGWLKDYNAYWNFVAWGSSGRGSGGTITSLPAAFLIGPDGKFLAVNLTGDDIAKAVTKALGKPK